MNNIHNIAKTYGVDLSDAAAIDSMVTKNSPAAIAVSGPRRGARALDPVVDPAAPAAPADLECRQCADPIKWTGSVYIHRTTGRPECPDNSETWAEPYGRPVGPAETIYVGPSTFHPHCVLCGGYLLPCTANSNGVHPVVVGVSER